MLPSPGCQWQVSKRAFCNSPLPAHDVRQRFSNKAPTLLHFPSERLVPIITAEKKALTGLLSTGASWEGIPPPLFDFSGYQGPGEWKVYALNLTVQSLHFPEVVLAPPQMGYVCYLFEALWKCLILQNPCPQCSLCRNLTSLYIFWKD